MENTENQERCLVVKLAPASPVTEEMVRHLHTLLRSHRPIILYHTLLELYQRYIINEHDALPVNFDDIAATVYILSEFLKDLEDEYPSTFQVP
jgi:hypothetical protein